jgi:hypothetical protein
MGDRGLDAALVRLLGKEQKKGWAVPDSRHKYLYERLVGQQPFGS